MSERENPWLSPNRSSVLIPSSATPGGLLPSPPPTPPDPPDPPPSFLADFPLLSTSVSTPRKARSPMQISPPKGTASGLCISGCLPITDVPQTQISQIHSHRSATLTPISGNTIHNSFTGLKALPIKTTSPLFTNPAAASTPAPSPSSSPLLNPNPYSAENLPPHPPLTLNPNPPPAQSPPAAPPINISHIPPLNLPPQPKAPSPESSLPQPPTKPTTWADKARTGIDRSLKRMAPTELSAEGIPQVTIPDAVFERGAAMLQDYIVGSFFAKMPSYKSIENVLNYLWGKGVKLEIHTNKINRTMLVRIPNQFIRRKVIEKRLWYIGSAMFHVSPWSPASTAAPELSSIPIWAHLKGVPLDLRSLEGLGFAASLVGEPKETDEFTANLTSIEVAHVKVDADLSQQLPRLVQIKRQSGEIIPVQVEYPWVPPSCSFCNQIGHIVRDCLHTTQTWVPTNQNKQSPNDEPVKNQNKDKEVVTESTHDNAAPASSSSAGEKTLQVPNVNPECPVNTIPPASSGPSLPESGASCAITHVPVVFSSSTTDGSLTVIPTKSPRKQIYPSKNRPSLKRPFLSSAHSDILASNPFAILLTSPKKTLKITSEKDQNHPPDPSQILLLPAPPLPPSDPFSNSPRVGPLLIQGVPPDTSL